MKYFKISMSTKDKIIIDEQDFLKLEGSMGTGNLIKLKKGIVNPSFIVSIYPISPKEALDNESQNRKIEGYIDEKTGKYITTREEYPTVQGLEDGFKSIGEIMS